MVVIHEVSTVAAAVVVLITTAAAILAVIDVATPTPTTEKGIIKLPIIIHAILKKFGLILCADRNKELSSY